MRLSNFNKSLALRLKQASPLPLTSAQPNPVAPAKPHSPLLSKTRSAKPNRPSKVQQAMLCQIGYAGPIGFAKHKLLA